jgi:hypothetical protein
MLHHATLGAAVKKYGPLHTSGQTEAEVKEAIAGDEKDFNADAVNEIYAAITAEVEQPKASAHIVSTEFRDKDNFDTRYEIGDDVSHFDEVRLADLVERGLVTPIVN